MKWKPALAICLIFLLGAGAGSLGTIAWDRTHPGPPFGSGGHGPHPEGDNFMMRRLTQELNLDEPQRTQLKGILEDMFREMRQVRLEVEPKARGILDRNDQRIREILRPDQQQKFDQMLQQRNQRWKNGHAQEPPK